MIKMSGTPVHRPLTTLNYGRFGYHVFKRKLRLQRGSTMSRLKINDVLPDDFVLPYTETVVDGDALPDGSVVALPKINTIPSRSSGRYIGMPRLLCSDPESMREAIRHRT
jgi:hypothetical protein